MAVNPEEQESQIVAPLHSPPPEQIYLDEAFPGGADGYHNEDNEQHFVADDEEMDNTDAEADGMDLDSQPVPQQASNKSFVEETQFADIEKDTQATGHQEEFFEKEIQNADFSSRSFVEETQYVGIEIDTQATEDTPQFPGSDPSFQRQDILENDEPSTKAVHHTNMSPPKFILKPKVPEEAPFKFGIPAHARRNREPTVQNLSTSKVASQPEKVLLPGATLMHDSRGESSTKPLQSTQKALFTDHETTATHSVSDSCTAVSVKSFIEKEAIRAAENMALVEQVSDGRNSPLLNSVEPPRDTLLTTCNGSRNQEMPHRAGSSTKTQVPEREVGSVIRNNSAASPPQIPNKCLVDPSLQTKKGMAGPHNIFSQSASGIGLSKDENTFDKPNKLSALRASHNQQSKPDGPPLTLQSTVTPAHIPQRPRMRQKSSNQLNRVSVKTKFHVQNMVKKAPFPEASSDEPKLRVHRYMATKTQVPASQSRTQPQHSESRSTEEGSSTRIEAAVESESRRLTASINPMQSAQLGSKPQPITSDMSVSPSRVQESNFTMGDSTMRSAVYEENQPVETFRQPRQSIPISEFQPSHSVAHTGCHESMHPHPSRFVSQANISRPHSRQDSSRPLAATRTQTGHQIQQRYMNRPVKSHDLEPQGISEASPSHIGRTKVAKATAVPSQGESYQIGDHISSRSEKPALDFDALHHVVMECQRQQEVIQSQVNSISDLNIKLQDAEAQVRDTRVINEELEVEKDELSKRVQRLKDLSNRYRQHINEVVVCQKSLKQDSKEMKKSVANLELGSTKESEDRQAQINRITEVLEEIKQIRGDKTQQELRDAKFKALGEKIDALQRENDCLKAVNNSNIVEVRRDKTRQDLNAKFKALGEKIDLLQRENARLKALDDSNMVELQQERLRIEVLEKQVSNSGLDRHKELMEILQKPQVDTLGELTKEDGILSKVLSSSEGVQGKFNEISKTIISSLNQTSEWQQTLTKILEDFYTGIQTRLNDNGSKDTNFQESTVKLFDDLREYLNQINGDLNEKIKLSEQLNVLRDSNATLKANLNSKDAVLENHIARMHELTQELADVRLQLINKAEQLAISNAQPREDPELKKKVDDLVTEISRLQKLLSTANDGKSQAENSAQIHQATITSTQNQLREKEDKLRNAKSTIEKMEGNNQKLQIECRSAMERVRQETTQLALSQKKDLVAQHDSLVNDLKHKQAETEKKLHVTVEKSKKSQWTIDEHTKTINRLKSEIATYKDQVLQQKLQLQSLEESSISASQLQKYNQEILSIRQEQENQRASSNACRDEYLRINGEIEGAQKRLRDMNEANELLMTENGRLRKRLEDASTVTEEIVGGPNRVDDARPSSRRPAERKSINFHSQPHDKLVGRNHSEFKNDAVLASSSLRTTSSASRTSSSRAYGDNSSGNWTPIKPSTNNASLETSPLTDLEDIMPNVESAHSREELQQVYNKNRQVVNDKVDQVDSVRSKYYPHGEHTLGTPKSKFNKVVIAIQGELVNTPNQAPGLIPSLAEENIQRRMNKPTKSALKKTDHQDSFIIPDGPQSQVYNPIFKKPAPRNNRGLDTGLHATRGTGASSYNRIASSTPQVSNSRAPEPRYEPTPEIKRNAIKRARSNSSLAAQNLQPAKPAKAPRMYHRQPSNKAIIPDSQDRL
ncbi:3a57fe20-1310-4ffe-adb9-110df8352a76 [Sclerotinia trifoliorum]|uniref:3a57fe20-1310-4ffe-adb9-110df8352a76 n=1 Tax=Sclerotinia trifoliorum TaxID=28548 RepID=A0A8H2ZX32_9HELO|nr:3a57fe20-1310-4ffe-adb9-110df8352a76 [Sclerotinia trifoliorum]